MSVGNDAYSGTVGIVAPPPEVVLRHRRPRPQLGDAAARRWSPSSRSVLALTGRRRAAFALVPVGIAAVAISLAVDAPKGLDEGAAAIAYEGATATLLKGFWMQIATGAVLIACGLMLPLLPAPGAGRAARTATGPTPAPCGAGSARASSAVRGPGARSAGDRAQGQGPGSRHVNEVELSRATGCCRWR